MSKYPDVREAVELVKLLMKEDGWTVHDAVSEYAKLVEISKSQALREVGRELLDYSKELKASTK